MGRRVGAHLIGKRLHRLVEAARRRSARPRPRARRRGAGRTRRHKDAGDCSCGTFDPVRHLRTHPRVQAPSETARGRCLAPGRSTGRQAARAPRPASRVKQATAGLLARGSFACRRLPRVHPSGQVRQAFRLQLRGQLRNSGENPSPHSLFTPHLRGDRHFRPSLKGWARSLSTETRPASNRACGSASPVSIVLPSSVPAHSAGRKTGTR